MGPKHHQFHVPTPAALTNNPLKSPNPGKATRGCSPQAAVAFWKFHLPLLQRRERNFAPPSSIPDRRLSFSSSSKTSQKRTWKIPLTIKKSRDQNLEGSETARLSPNLTLHGDPATLMVFSRHFSLPNRKMRLTKGIMRGGGNTIMNTIPTRTTTAQIGSKCTVVSKSTLNGCCCLEERKVLGE